MDTNLDQPNSIQHLSRTELFPIPISAGDHCFPAPFPLLPGEGVVDCCILVDGQLILTNYRLYLCLGDANQSPSSHQHHHMPLGLVEVVEHKDLFYLHVGCKDARTYRCTFDNNEQCLGWFGQLLKASEPPRELQQLFAFSYYAWSREGAVTTEDDVSLPLDGCRTPVYDDKAFMNEVERLQFGSVWRISSVNEKYNMCGSYPPKLLVPANIQDDKLEAVAKFRSSRRIPAVVWRHVGNGAVIARCSQPEVGWLGWRSSDDEDLIKEILHACNIDAVPNNALDHYSHSPVSSGLSSVEGVVIDTVSLASGAMENGEVNGEVGGGGGGEVVTDGGSGMVNGVMAAGVLAGVNQAVHDLQINSEKKVLIMDARSYTTAVANRARGGGCECPEYYPTCEIQFMNLANIHSIRKSFHALRQLCTTAADQPTWFSLLEGTRWLLHMSGLMKAAVTLVTAVERDGRPALVHCSDGWDRTPQIVALAQLLLDPYYRTIHGFRILIEREWLAFGHKFADRCGHTTGSDDQNERCPVFLQWLDCVHQLVEQFPCRFEFSHTYLVKLVQHTYSNLFGTFLCNTKRDRDKEWWRTFSVWTFLDSPTFKNYLYKPPPPNAQVLWPKYNVRDLKLWSAVYLGSFETANHYSINPSRTTPITINPTTPSTTAHNHTITNNGPNHTSSNNTGSNGACMTKTRSYGDLLTAATGTGTGSDSGGGGGRSGAESVVTDGKSASSVAKCNGQCSARGVVVGGATGHLRRGSDPSSITETIKLNLSMTESTALFSTTNDLTATNLDTPDTDNDTPLTLTPSSSHKLNTSLQTDLPIPHASISSKTTNHTKQQDVTIPDHTVTTTSPSIDINHNDSDKQRTVLYDVATEVRQDGDVLTSSPLELSQDEEDDEITDTEKSKSECTITNTTTEGGNSDSLTVTVTLGECTAAVVTSAVTCVSLMNGNSVETSTETLVSENIVYGSSPTTDHHLITTVTPTRIQQQHTHNCPTRNNTTPFLTNTTTITTTTTNCTVCAQNKRFIHNNCVVQQQQQPSTLANLSNAATSKQQQQQQPLVLTSAQAQSAGTIGTTAVDSCYSYNYSCNGLQQQQQQQQQQHSGGTTPSFSSRAGSVSGGTTACWEGYNNSVVVAGGGGGGGGLGTVVRGGGVLPLGDDGLAPLFSELQDRVWAMREEHRREVEGLRREVQTYRNALIQQVCHRCNHNDTDRYDDTSSALGSTCSELGEGECCGEGAAVESLRSDMSWEAVEEDGMNVGGLTSLGAGTTTLWMPDHAVSKCTDCQIEFWIGRRRHHCRKCGLIFCAECSEHYTPIPAEQLYNPVRVCRGCYHKLCNGNSVVPPPLPSPTGSDITPTSSLSLAAAAATTAAATTIPSPQQQQLVTTTGMCHAHHHRNHHHSELSQQQQQQQCRQIAASSN